MDPRNWEYDFSVKKVYEDEDILSLLMKTYQYTGGAHGSSGRFGIVFDKKTGKQLSITDIFEERPLVYRLGLLWRLQILSRIQEMNGEVTGSDRIWVREGTVDSFHYASFTLTDKFITIY
jgi:Deacetylase PdaC